ncbi:MAG: GntR family transcriptional regulator, partial [Firmicutes bacterium]|nr:GntR family transcriptional regulator [Bacillota bacterium]
MKQITLGSDNSNRQFLYEQLYDTIKTDILNGSIKAGEKLPSLRSLSKDLEISLTTIEQAYNQLMVEGYIESRPQSGFFAMEINSIRREEQDESVEEITYETLQENEFIHDPSSFDFTKWKKCSNEVFNYYSDQLLFE